MPVVTFSKVLGRVGPVERRAIGLATSPVTVDLHQVIADEVHGAGQQAQGAFDPHDELVPVALEVGVMVDGAWVVAGADQFQVEAVDATAVPEDDFVDGLLVGEGSPRGGLGHGRLLSGSAEARGRRQRTDQRHPTAVC